METEIFYFSGTGNSLFAAKELQKRLPDSALVPIASLLDKSRVHTIGSRVGLVFPVHALTIPVVVKRFIKKTDFSTADYLFAVATRFGSVFRGFDKIDRLLRKNRKKLSSRLVLNMANNESRHKGYVVPAKEAIQTMEQVVLQKLDDFAGIVKDRKVSLPDDTGVIQPTGKNRATSFLIEKTVLAGMELSDHIGGVQYFYTNESCNGCGICEKVCLSGKIKLKDTQPVWQKNIFCTMCFACLNFCPQRAVQIDDIPGVPSFTRENGRYSHPYASIGDMTRQRDMRE